MDPLPNAARKFLPGEFAVIVDLAWKGQGLARAHGPRLSQDVAEKATSWAALAPDRD